MCNPTNKHIPPSGNGEKSEDPVLDPDADPDHRQHLITSHLDEV